MFDQPALVETAPLCDPASTDVRVETEPRRASDEDYSPEIDNILRLYPQQEELWITKDGFAHPKGAPDWLTVGARLYRNKYFKG